MKRPSTGKQRIRTIFVTTECDERTIISSDLQATMAVNWDAQREMDKDIEENAELYAALADDSDDEKSR